MGAHVCLSADEGRRKTSSPAAGGKGTNRLVKKIPLSAWLGSQGARDASVAADVAAITLKFCFASTGQGGPDHRRRMHA